MLTIGEIIKKYSLTLDCLDLELLISYIIKKPREFVMAHPEYGLTDNQRLTTNNLLNRRAKGEPLAYILGHKEFYGLDFKVNSHVLIPRPETELLVEQAIQELTTINKQPIIIADVGTGTGNIIISLVKKIKSCKLSVVGCKFIGIDISGKALGVARQNSRLHKVNKKIKFLKGSLLLPVIRNLKLATRGTQKIMIIANLPYLSKKILASAPKDVKKYEPKIALLSGTDGLDAYRKLAEQTKKLLRITNYKSQITLLCEIGPLQISEMKKIFSFAKKIEFIKDLAGRWRVCKIQI